MMMSQDQSRPLLEYFSSKLHTYVARVQIEDEIYVNLQCFKMAACTMALGSTYVSPLLFLSCCVVVGEVQT